MLSDKTIKLIGVVCAAWSKCLPSPFGDGEFFPVEGETFCNRYVNLVLTAYDYKKMLGLMANEMYAFLGTHIEDWLEVGGDVAQTHANDGGVVVAALKNLLGHGHVSIVFPGTLGNSSHWNSTQVPKLANVGGAEFCKISVGANWCFHDMPKFFVLKETIS